MSRARHNIQPGSAMFVRGNSLHSPQSTMRNASVHSTDISQNTSQSSSTNNPSHNIRTHAINYGEILSRRESAHRTGDNRPSINAQQRQRNSRNQTTSGARIGSIRSTENIHNFENSPNSSTSTTSQRLGQINRRLRNNLNNINQPASAMSNISPVASIQASHERLVRQQQSHRYQNQQQRQLRNLMIQQHQQSLQLQRNLARQRHQQQLHQYRMNQLISLLSENEAVLRSREERDSQLHRISTMSDEALSIIERIHSNLERHEDEEIFGIEYVDDDNNDFGIDDDVERIIENGLYQNENDDSSDEFDAEDENGNIIHVVKKKMRPNVPVTKLDPRVVTDDEIKSGLECPICISEFKKGDIIAELKCSHLFHKDCVAEWVKKHPTCPVCRASTV
ncbi:hypothetical protein M9Y10_013974 [Tritrichomonas musculus]|uniref:RING-type domain-containing protein n=1 Tax=Tritrichomonas musculus TaxID=1915356 RepID=A0ABR2KYG6_9EUKA